LSFQGEVLIREDDYRDGRRFLFRFQSVGRLKAVLDRHIDVEQDDIGEKPPGRLASFGAVRGMEHLKTDFGKQGSILSA